MKVSEVINALQGVLREHGDLKVVTGSSMDCFFLKPVTINPRLVECKPYAGGFIEVGTLKNNPSNGLPMYHEPTQSSIALRESVWLIHF